MDNDLRICTWNVRTLHMPGAVKALKKVLVDYSADIIALQEKYYDLLDKAFRACPQYDVKIVLGDFNAKLERGDCGLVGWPRGRAEPFLRQHCRGLVALL